MTNIRDYMNWIAPLSFPALEIHEAHIWLVDLKNHISNINSYEELLSTEEIARAERLQKGELYQKFVIFRGVLRQLLSKYLHIPANQLSFNYTEKGKPFINEKIEFNVSHSRELAVIAVTKGYPVGIDIEYKRPVNDLNHLCNRFLSQLEYEEICASSEDQRFNVFYNIWVKKEAYIKALGGRLFEELARLKQHNGPLDTFLIRNIDIGDLYACALATTFNIKTIYCWNAIHFVE